MAQSISRKIKESPLYIGKNETIPYTLDFAGYVPTAVTSLSSPSVTLYDVTNGEPGDDVSTTKLTGAASFTNLVMTLKLITGLAPDRKYLLRCRGTGGGGTYELWAEVYGER